MHMIYADGETRYSDEKAAFTARFCRPRFYRSAWYSAVKTRPAMPCYSIRIRTQ